ncbi:MAG: efflux RND transporter periplasmic adaptor subunit [Pseudomonadales bacterium]
MPAVLSKEKWLAPVLVLLIGAALSWFLLTGKPKPEARPIGEPVAQRVEVLRVKPGKHTLTVTTQGSVAPRREIDLVAQVAGTVQAVAGDFAAGGFADAGEMLVQIDRADYEIALMRAKAMLADAEQNLATVKGQARQAKREWRDVGNAEANALFLKKPQVASAQAQLAAAKADLRKAQLDLQRTQISAPFAGRIREKLVDIGQYVTPGLPVARVYATMWLK